MSLPVVAIVGRPNVGKSSLLNCLAGHNIGIVDPMAGVTRDRVSAICHTGNVYYELVDTGGFGIEDRDDLTEHIEQQIRYAVNEAALVLFVVDVRDAVTMLDEAVAQMLRASGRRVLVVANKVDTAGLEPLAGEFHKLGFGGAVAVSARHRIGRSELVEHIAAVVGPLAPTEVPEPVLKIAVVGKRNSGKSTFINAIAGAPRVIVSEVPGTTRDAIDVRFEKDGKTFVVIDTAGVHRKSRSSNDVDFYSFVRAQRSIVRAGVVLLFIDASEPVSQVDKKLARFIAENDKPCILVVNKWDLAKGRADTRDYESYLAKALPGVDYAPISVITAKENVGTQATIDLAIALFKQALTRVGTAQLNEAIERVSSVPGPATRRGRGAIKIYYATQVAVNPPTIVLFVKNPEQAHDQFRRFLINRLREALPFEEIPIRLIFRSHRRQKVESRPP